MLSYFRLAILCLAIPTVLTSVCEDFVARQEQRKSSNDYSNLTPEEIAFNDFSGSTNDGSNFGNQDLCNQNPNMYYFVTVYSYQIETGFLQPSYQEHALCLPRDCSILLHTTNDPLLTRIYWVRGYNAYNGPPLLNVNNRLFDPTQNIKSKPFMFYCVCAFIALFVFLSIASTIVLYHRNKKIDLVDLESSQKKEQNKENHRFDWVLKSFDLKENLINLYQTAEEQKQNQNIAVFQFLRIITSYYVIFYHVSGLVLSIYPTVIRTAEQQREYFSGYEHQIQRGGDLTVEYFYMMTGFLGAYTLVPKLSKEKLKIMTFVNIIKHRILRVRPLYVVALLVMWQVMPFLTTGPRWHTAELNSMVCDKTWWRGVLMVDNILNLKDLSETEGYCFLYGWYLSAEFQIYLAAIIAIAVYAKYRRIGYLLMVALVLQSFALALSTHFKFKIDWYQYSAETFIWSLTKHKYLPYVRWYTLFIGVLWGMLYYEYSKLKKKNIFWVFETKPILSYVTMICGIVLNLFVLLGQFNRKAETMSEGERYAWDPLRMLLITISITMIFMPLLSNRQFYLKSFFNLRVFQILGKTSYAVYLFQVDFIYLVEYTNLTTYPYSYGRLLIECVKVIAATQAFGFLAHIFLEKPMLNIETHLSKPKQGKSIPKGSDARIEIPIKRNNVLDNQKLLPDHVRPVELEMASRIENEQIERITPEQALPIELDNGSSAEKEQKLSTIQEHNTPVDFETGSLAEKEQNEIFSPSTAEIKLIPS